MSSDTSLTTLLEPKLLRTLRSVTFICPPLPFEQLPLPVRRVLPFTGRQPQRFFLVDRRLELRHACLNRGDQFGMHVNDRRADQVVDDSPPRAALFRIVA